MMAACLKNSQLVNELIPLQTDRDRVKQIINNFGFDKIAATQDDFGSQAYEQRHADQSTVAKIKDMTQPNRNREMFLETFNQGLDKAVEAVKASEQISPSNMRWLLAGSKGDSALQRAVEQLNKTPMVNRLEILGKVTQNASRLTSAFDLVTAEGPKEIAWRGASIMATELGGPWGFLAAELEWAYNNVSDAVTGQLLKANIEKMASMTEGDLKLLQNYTKQMANIGKRIGNIKAELATVPCNSTDPSLAPRRTADMAPPDGPAEPKSGGKSTGKIIGGVLLAGGAGVATYVALDAASKAIDDSVLSTGGGGSGNSGGGGSGGGGGSSTPSTVGLGSFSCSALNAAGTFRTCTGAINVRAGTLLAAKQGTTVTVLTAPGFFHGTFVAPGLSGTTGTVSMTITPGSACPGTQTSIGFYLVGSNVAFEALTQSIPVSCR